MLYYNAVFDTIKIIVVYLNIVKAANESSSALKGVTAASKVYTLSQHTCVVIIWFSFCGLYLSSNGFIGNYSLPKNISWYNICVLVQKYIWYTSNTDNIVFITNIIWVKAVLNIISYLIIGIDWNTLNESIGRT